MGATVPSAAAPGRRITMTRRFVAAVDAVARGPGLLRHADGRTSPLP